MTKWVWDLAVRIGMSFLWTIGVVSGGLSLSWADQSMQHRDLRRNASLYQAYDIDSDGRVSLPEYLGNMDLTIAAGDVDSDRGLNWEEVFSLFRDWGMPMKLTPILQKRFDMADADRNGVMDLQELKKAAPIFAKRMDRNKDGFISLREFADIETNMQSSGRDEKKAVFFGDRE